MRRNFDPARRPELEDQLPELRRQGLTLEQISQLDGWPTRPTLRKWMRENPGLAAQSRIGREQFRDRAERFPFQPATAARLLQRIRLGYPIADLVREPDMPQRRALNAWKLANPAFAADLARATAQADASRRRSGASARGHRRSRWPYDEAIGDRIILALIRGATLPDLGRDPTLPTGLGLERWRKLHPDFDGAVRAAMRAGHRARGRARTAASVTPALIATIEDRILNGASLHSLSKQADMPSLHSLYKWTRENPDLADAVEAASAGRDEAYLDQALDLAQTRGAAAERQVKALFKRIGQLNPNPGQRRRERR